MQLSLQPKPWVHRKVVIKGNNKKQKHILFPSSTDACNIYGPGI